MVRFEAHRLAAFAELDQAETTLLHSLSGEPYPVARTAAIRSEGDPVACVFLLLDGWATSCITLPSGHRQIVKVHLPGDVLGAPSMCLTRAAETIAAYTDCVVAPLPLAAFGEMFAAAPRLASLFFLAAQQERVELQDRLTTVGRASARERLAAFLVHLFDRLSVLGKVQGDMFELPLTQDQLGDVLGLTSVHVNRTLKGMERDGLLSRVRSHLYRLRLDQLRPMSPIPPRALVRSPAWLPTARIPR